MKKLLSLLGHGRGDVMHSKHKVFCIAECTYLVLHSLFLLLWGLRVINVRWLWFALWFPICIFIFLRLWDDTLSAYMKHAGKALPCRIIACIWILSCGFSSLFHSPFR